MRGKELLRYMKTRGISAEDGKRIIYRQGSLLLSEREILFEWEVIGGKYSDPLVV